MPKTILVVEDNDIHGGMVKDLLEMKGYQVLWAQSGTETFSVLENERPDLILMDMQLPDFTGEEVTMRIKADESLSAIPIVAVTAFASKDDENTMRNAGCCGFVSKPFEFADFFKTLESVLGEG